MSDLRKAAEMALEVLSHSLGHSNEAQEQIDKTKQALRQALAQPEQVLTAKVVVTGIEHEPYGYVWTSLRDGMEVRFSRMPPNKFYSPQNIKPVYTAPPKREWQGLTDDEMRTIKQKSVDDGMTRIVSDFEYIRSIEAKLKEKNGG